MGKNKKFQCFICYNKDIDLEKNKVYAHESLHVSICNRCRGNHVSDSKWHGGDEWKDFDERGKCIYCEICGEGGTLMCCDNNKCSHSFCLTCLEAWLGKKTLEDFLADDKLHFACFVCTYKEGESGLNKMYPVYSKFVRESQKYFDDEASINRNKKSNESKSQKVKEKISNGKAEIKQQVASFVTYDCFSCFKRFDHPKIPMKLHNKLKVAMCKACYDYLQSDDWTFTDGKSDYCVVTGDGGEIISCDSKKCTNSFDVATLKKWMAKSEVNQLLEDEEAEFKCFKCNPKLGKYQKFIESTKNFQERIKDAENPVTDLISPSKKRKDRDSNDINGITSPKKAKISEKEAKKLLLACIKSLDSDVKETEIYKSVSRMLR